MAVPSTPGRRPSPAGGLGDERRVEGAVFERFTERARQVVVLAQDEARALGHNYIETEHILLGIVRENDGVAARILLDFDADAQTVRNATIEILPGAYQKAVGEELGAEPPLQVPMPGVSLPRMHRGPPRR